MRLCIHNARLVTAQREFIGGILVDESGKIADILKGHDKASADIIVDAGGRLLFAGFVDAHVHLRDPGLTHKEDFSSGTLAAACGGVTTVMCMPNTNPPIDSVENFRLARAAGEGRSYVDFTLQASLGPDNLDNITALWQAGITSFESSLSDGKEGVKVLRLDDTGELVAAFEALAALDAIVGLYTGNQMLTDALVAKLRREGLTDSRAHAAARPPLAEAIGIATVIEAARITGTKIVFRQVTTKRGFDLLRRAKSEFQKNQIAIEVTPHNLHLTLEALETVGRHGQIIPPLRDETDRHAAVQALADGTVDFVGSDHAPHTKEEKECESAWDARNGSPGLDTLAAAVLDLASRGFISYPRVAEVLGEAPARIFGIANRKGRLAIGADGDFVLVDPSMERRVNPDLIRSKARRSVFEGVRLRGWPTLTILGGVIIAEEGILTGPPRGQFISRDENPSKRPM